jgi:hypothetical protein
MFNAHHTLQGIGMPVVGFDFQIRASKELHDLSLQAAYFAYNLDETRKWELCRLVILMG